MNVCVCFEYIAIVFIEKVLRRTFNGNLWLVKPPRKFEKSIVASKSLLLLRRLPRVLPPRLCLPYTYVNFNAKSHKTKIENFVRIKTFLKFCTYQDITFVNLNTNFHKILSKDFFLISVLILFVHYSKMYRCNFFKIWQENNQNTNHWFASIKTNLPKEILKMARNIEKTCFIEGALLPW